jgi:hypothetical protein
MATVQLAAAKEEAAREAARAELVSDIAEQNRRLMIARRIEKVETRRREAAEESSRPEYFGEHFQKSFR